MILKNKLIVFIFFIGLLYFSMYVYLKISPLNIRNFENYRGCFFDSNSSDSGLSKYKTITTEYKQGPKELLINFRFKVYRFGDYNNIFQTAPGNSGIRMELTSPSTLALIVNCGKSAGIRGLVVTSAIETNKWYSLFVKVDCKNHLNVFLNNYSMINQTIPVLNYEISDIAVGTGFSKTRKFDGAISDLNFELKSNSENKYLDSCRKFLGFFLFLLIIILILINIKWLLNEIWKAWKFCAIYLTKNVLLLYFFIYSFSLFLIARKIALRFPYLGRLKADTVVFNFWVSGLTFSDKNKDLVVYLFSIFIIFIYYSLFFILAYCRTKIGKGFELFFTIKNRIVILLVVSLILNMLIVNLTKFLFPSGNEAIQLLLWSAFFVIPFIIPKLIKND
ncbi:MAG: hypothetical protein NT094_02515 [Candidatus Staskawiczbacteria bacterium]|nr:hypothetical protein [Candidatus Staskawiczbacteria bacterium]